MGLGLNLLLFTFTSRHVKFYHSVNLFYFSFPVSVSRVPTDTEMYLIYFKNLFPLDKFEHRLPPMVLKHQLYSLNKNRTVVDKELVG